MDGRGRVTSTAGHWFATRQPPQAKLRARERASEAVGATPEEVVAVGAATCEEAVPVLVQFEGQDLTRVDKHEAAGVGEGRVEIAGGGVGERGCQARRRKDHPGARRRVPSLRQYAKDCASDHAPGPPLGVIGRSRCAGDSARSSRTDTPVDQSRAHQEFIQRLSSLISLKVKPVSSAGHARKVLTSQLARRRIVERT